MTVKIIKLERPVIWFDKQISEVTLREPTGGEYILLGDPGIPVYGKDGTFYYVENQSVISSYLDKCLAVDNGSQFLAMLSLKETKKIKSELLGFFSEAATSEPIS